MSHKLWLLLVVVLIAVILVLLDAAGFLIVDLSAREGELAGEDSQRVLRRVLICVSIILVLCISSLIALFYF